MLHWWLVDRLFLWRPAMSLLSSSSTELGWVSFLTISLMCSSERYTRKRGWRADNRCLRFFWWIGTIVGSSKMAGTFLDVWQLTVKRIVTSITDSFNFGGHRLRTPWVILSSIHSADWDVTESWCSPVGTLKLSSLPSIFICTERLTEVGRFWLRSLGITFKWTLRMAFSTGSALLCSDSAMDLQSKMKRFFAVHRLPVLCLALYTPLNKSVKARGIQ